VKRDHHVGRSWWAPLAELDYQRWRKRRQKAAEAAPAPVPRTPEGILRIARAAALWAIAAIIAAASAASFAESYRGLYVWALRHRLSGFWAAAFPLQVDSFIGVGELVLFIATVDQWRRGHRAGAWAVALLGLAVSVAGNIGHVGATDAQSRGTAAVPPVAAFAALWLGLTVLKRVLARHAEAGTAPARTVPASAPVPVPAPALNGHGTEAERLFAGELAAGDVPSIRRIRAALHVGQPRARQIQAHLETLTPAGRDIARIRDEIRQNAAELTLTP
jgi:hypothetical protein